MISVVIPEWHQRANCQGADTDQFYPEKGGRNRHAKRICDRCEVKAECLDWAITNDERYGTWGGMSEHERRLLRRDRGAA